MSRPDLPSHEFSAHLNREKEFTGSYLVSKEEWLEACKHDPFLLKIEDYIQQDKAFIANCFTELKQLMKPVLLMRNRVKNMRNRIASRKRQYKHFAKLLRKRMAREKMIALRKETNL
jgi:hypothetical protein